MKIPLKLKCTKCDTQARVRIHLNATSFDWKCPNCGLDHPSFFATNVTMGYLILERSRDEYFERDYSMSIVMAAMAFECELSRLFGKWRKFDTEMAGGAHPNAAAFVDFERALAERFGQLHLPNGFHTRRGIRASRVIPTQTRAIMRQAGLGLSLVLLGGRGGSMPFSSIRWFHSC